MHAKHSIRINPVVNKQSPSRRNVVQWSGSWNHPVELLMDVFVSRKRPRIAGPGGGVCCQQCPTGKEEEATGEDQSTDMKLALLLSLFPDMDQHSLLDTLVACDGSVDTAASEISAQRKAAASLSNASTKRKHMPGSHARVQKSLPSFFTAKTKHGVDSTTLRPLTKKGKTLHLYSPEDVAAYTPCSIIHNFLPPEDANDLLLELVKESESFSRYKFQLFERTVESPHTSSLYVASPEDRLNQSPEYVYGGRHHNDVRHLTSQMRKASVRVQQAVNEEVQKRIRTCYPGQKKLKYQSSKEWVPNAAFVNCYNGSAESVGYHSDGLSELGPRAIIGSLSLGVEREFRVRKIQSRDSNHDIVGGDEDEVRREEKRAADARADAEGQISIHLPHNSLLVMHPMMQEEWKHSIPPVQTISPHPVSENRRINITYRWYRESFHPRYRPRCRCGMPTILKCVQRKQETRGRYMWLCSAGFMPEKQSCSFFQWADFDDDGEPIWRR